MSSDTNSNSSSAALVAELEAAGVELWEEDGRIRFRAPRGVLTQERKEALRADRDGVIDVLRAEAGALAVTPDPASRYEPFPLTDIQSAYLLGQYDTSGLGGVGCHSYAEVSYPELAPDRVEDAWNRLVERHDMLRCVFSAEGYQQILPKVDRYRVAVADLRGMSPERVDQARQAVRAELDHRMPDPGTWPLFELRVTRSDDEDTLHISFDSLVADWSSAALLMRELETLVDDPTASLRAPAVTFRDYVLAERRLRDGPRYLRDRDYWVARVDDLPPAPELSYLEQGDGEARFTRHHRRLPREGWQALSDAARHQGLTPTSAVLTAYAAVVQRWSRNPRLTLDITLLNRREDLHPDVSLLVGDFTSVSLLAVEEPGTRSFAEHARAVQEQLAEDLSHRLCSGVEVLRELSRHRGKEAATMPVVFTSGIGVGPSAGSGRGRQGAGLTQTPQVALDCQVADDEEGLRIDIDTRVGVLPDGLVADMADAMVALLSHLGDEETWALPAGSAHLVPLPEWQQRERQEANSTCTAVRPRALHDAVLDQACRTPQAPAVVTPTETITYAELVGWAGATAEELRSAGTREGDYVSVIMDKGVEQVVAVLAVLMAGGAYLPIDTSSPAPRRQRMVEAAKTAAVLTQGWVETGVDVATQVVVSRPTKVPGVREVMDRVRPVDPDSLAYVIFTSGSSGTPKGVMTTHKAAWNTIADIVSRFGVGPGDKVLGVAQLGFDLSVFDIFGPLSVGGALVLPQADRRNDPSHWADLLFDHQVTVWNSVPAQMQMLADYAAYRPGCLSPLRLVLLSGDWIPVTLPDRVHELASEATMVSLGGATEAAIWSIYHVIDSPVPPGTTSIPYGRPLANQAFRVVDSQGRDAPVWVPGELCIGGAGLARGYLADPALTADRFPSPPGGRIYRTGDMGRYLPGGGIELLGREDAQVKIRGHRIELGEIESVLLTAPGVGAAAAVVARRDDRQSLVGFVEPRRGSIDAEALARYARQVSQAIERTVALPERAGDSHQAAEVGGDTVTQWVNRVVAAAVYRAAVAQATGEETAAVRVVELGGGDGVTTEAVLPVLKGLNVDYLFTDAEPSLVDKAASRFSSAGRGLCRSALLDVDRGLREQGYEPATADVVVSTGVLGRSSDPAAGVQRALSLLRPGGVLVMVEPGGEDVWDGGSMPLTAQAWRDVLTSAGSRLVLEPAAPAGSRPTASTAAFVAVARPDLSPLRVGALLAHLQENLPAYMVPERLQVVERLPLTGNGKVDRNVLASWDVVPAGTGTETLVDDLEERVAALWSDLLDGEPVGRWASFFELGADSLVIAKAAGRLREEVPEAATVEFDVLLRSMLNEPTVGALARLLRHPQASREEAPAVPATAPERAVPVSHETGIRAEGSNALIVPFGGSKDGPLRVIFHAALGTLDTFQVLGGLMAEQDLGQVVGIAVADWDEYCAIQPAELVSRLADDYTSRLLSQPETGFQLVGHSLGGLLAVEVARRMLESGVPVADLTLIDSVPTLVSTDDELALEAVFVPNLRLDPGEVVLDGVDSADVFRAFMMVHERNGGHVPEGALAEVGGDPGLDAVAAAFRKRARIPQEERLASYAQASQARAGTPVEPELVPALYRVFRHSLLGSVTRLEPYFGDMTLLRATQRQSFGIIPGMEELAVPYWEDTCVGDLTVVDVGGHHLSCIEEPHVARVAALLGTAVTEGR